MDANWRPSQGSDPAAVGDWRAQLQPEERSRVVNQILDAMMKNPPLSVPGRLNQLQMIAEAIEDKFYAQATNHSDYVRKISLKVVSIETNGQQAHGNAQVIPNQNDSDGQQTHQMWIRMHRMIFHGVSSSTSAESSAETGDAGADYWQEEIYQMVKILKDQYFAELSLVFNKMCVKLQHVESIIPLPIPSEQYDKLKRFTMMLERILRMLQISKASIQPYMRYSVPENEKRIIEILNAARKITQPQVKP
ncbi:hypothetical protein ZWY2020_019552 [Hordeum vulgare]|nr:hypothetical protein ZWY2020_019552 [Hordeum vulgare]